MIIGAHILLDLGPLDFGLAALIEFCSNLERR
jgi:hypothetical protein